jgi:hypothetical protein
MIEQAPNTSAQQTALVGGLLIDGAGQASCRGAVVLIDGPVI